jgi:hypothetical protein
MCAMKNQNMAGRVNAQYAFVVILMDYMVDIYYKE